MEFEKLIESKTTLFLRNSQILTPNHDSRESCVASKKQPFFAFLWSHMCTTLLFEWPPGFEILVIEVGIGWKIDRGVTFYWKVTPLSFLRFCILLHTSFLCFLSYVTFGWFSNIYPPKICIIYSLSHPKYRDRSSCKPHIQKKTA